MPYSPIKKFPDIIHELNRKGFENEVPLKILRVTIKEVTGHIREETVSNIIKNMIELEWITETSYNVFTINKAKA